ncbi:MAG: hypothetical protein ABI865_06190 [Nitrosospira sp.]
MLFNQAKCETSEFLISFADIREAVWSGRAYAQRILDLCPERFALRKNLFVFCSSATGSQLTLSIQKFFKKPFQIVHFKQAATPAVFWRNFPMRQIKYFTATTFDAFLLKPSFNHGLTNQAI